MLARDEVEAIAQLARLHLTGDEIEQMRVDLTAILDYFKTLADVDTDGIAPMTHAVPMDLLLRADVVLPSLPAEEALAGAPAKSDDLFVVPSIIPT
jgi:aspartyl-tRNA(Asn)/glutamyl-tRNA(Gln) amidotransferase subunit C